MWTLGWVLMRAVRPALRGRLRRLTAVSSLVWFTTASALVGAPLGQAATDTRPNVILITTDDMNRTDLRWMPQTRRLLRDAGVEVDGFISNHPLCCPARAEILTGQYGQNNGVHDNGGPFGGYDSLADPGNHIGAWLEASGYQTAMVGKHLNGWEDRAEHQPGWTIFDPFLKGVYRPYDITMFNNGRPRLYNNIHTSDLVGELTVDLIKRFSSSDAPFFIWSSQLAPHRMSLNGHWVRPVPAERHQDLFPHAVPPSFADPAFNEDDVSDKPPWVQEHAMVPKRRMVAWHRARIRTLRSVDDQVAATLDALQDRRELDNTFIFFTSDNGFLLGEHRLQSKNTPYEQSLRVPLLVRGPGLPAGVVRHSTFGLVDLAPTFVQLSGAVPGRTLDGRSMLAALRSGAPGYDHYLIQAGADGLEWWWRGVRSRSYVYVRYDDGFEELYDMAKDPFQLKNVAGDPAYARVRAEYAARLARLESCVGAACQSGGAPTP
jgi:N-acetylglucosamine-6-sulfatase